LLALAGAGDVDGLRATIEDGAAESLDELIVRTYSRGLLALAESRFAAATSHFDRVLPMISRLNGSHAQNLLFWQIRDAAGSAAPQLAA